MKRTGIFETFLASMATTAEGVQVIAKILENDEKYARKLLGFALNEMVAPPIGDEDAEDHAAAEEDHTGEEESSEAGDEEGAQGEEGSDASDEEGSDASGEEGSSEDETSAPEKESGAAMAIKKAFAKYMSSM